MSAEWTRCPFCMVCWHEGCVGQLASDDLFLQFNQDIFENYKPLLKSLKIPMPDSEPSWWSYLLGLKPSDAAQCLDLR